MTGDYHFYGAPISYFSGKLRIYLQFKRIPYIDHLADFMAFKQVILPRTGMAYMPILVTPQDKILQDTTDIIDFLEARHPQRPFLAQDPLLYLIMRLVELWADEFLLYPGLWLRWGFPEQLNHIFDEFGRVTLHHHPGSEREIGQTQAQHIRDYLPKLGFDDPTVGQACFQLFERLLNRLDAILQKRDFVLGNSPCPADVYLMAPIYAHWMQDPIPAHLIRTRFQRVAMWADRMLSANAQPCDQNWNLDDVALALLAEIGAGFGTMITEGAGLLEEMLQEMPASTELPRGGPPMRTKILDCPVQRKANPYWFYKFQRVWDAWTRLDSPKDSIKLLQATGCLELVQFQASRRVGKNEQGRLIVL